MAEPNIDEVLSFLSEWKSGLEIKDRFQLSNSEFFHLKNWLLKGKFIEECEVSGLLFSQKVKLDGAPKKKTNRTVLYRAIPDK